MSHNSTFDSLVTGLSGDERIEMLKNISAAESTDEEPLFAEAEEGEAVNLEILHGRLGIFQKLILFIKSLFAQRDVLEVFEETMLSKHGYEIEHNFPGLLDAGKMSVGYVFAGELEALRNALSVFTDPLARAFGPEKRDFIAFLAGFELALLQDRLLENTDPERYIKENSIGTDFDIRKQMDGDLQEALKEITEADRAAMYRHVRSLYFLNELVFFPYSNILSSFSAEGEDRWVPLTELKNLILELGDVMAVQGRPPDETALKALFLFDPDIGNEETEAAKKNLLKALDRGFNGLSQVKKFNRAVPLRKLLKLCADRVTYSPEPIGGGEDWFALYRRFWENRLEQKMEMFTYGNKKIKLVDGARKLLAVSDLPLLENYSVSARKEDASVCFEMSLAFIASFVETLFLKEMHRVLKIFIVDGEFYKSQNREEFTDSYDGIKNSLTEVRELDRKLSPAGEYGLALSGIRNEMIKSTLRNRKLNAVMHEVETEAASIINSLRGHLSMLINVSKGMLFG
ncbi:MAG: hypothetical protein HN368_09730, partial [Spirochaetales bacterium]|nr:hypothetical protein [Spirochaetales bacterium]